MSAVLDDPGELPTLDASIVEDDDALAEAVDAVIAADPQAQERAAAVNMHMGWLRAAVDADTWKLVLEIEARSNERFADLAVVIARWAFEQGRRFPILHETSS